MDTTKQQASFMELPDNPFMRINGITLGTVRRDYAETCMDVTKDTLNIYDRVHGGAMFTMADCSAGIAARTDGRNYVTQDAAVQFIHNTNSGRIIARGRVFSRGHRVCLVEVDVTTERGELLLHGMFTMYCVSQG